MRKKYILSPEQKERQREISRQHYLRNRKAKSEYKPLKQRSEEAILNKDKTEQKRKDYCKKYAIKNQARIKEYHSDYNQANKEKLAVVSAASYSKHKKRYLAEASTRTQFLKATDHDFYMKRRLGGYRRRAKEKNIPFDLTVEFLNSIKTDKCPVLGFTLNYECGDITTNDQSAVHLDRVDNTKGYTMDNVCFISARANYVKRDSTIEELELILNYMKSRI